MSSFKSTVYTVVERIDSETPQYPVSPITQACSDPQQTHKSVLPSDSLHPPEEEGGGPQQEL